MTTSTLTLAEFLLARIAEDEATARAAGARDQTQWTVDETGCCVRVDDDGYLGDTETHFNGTAEHIARFGPARVLAECEAKRRIVELHEDVTANYLGAVAHCLNCGEVAPCATLQALALPYADHPDYRQEWRP